MALQARPYGGAGAQFIIGIALTIVPWFFFMISAPFNIKVKSCYNPLRLGTVIVLVSSGTDFVNTPRLYSDRATR